MGFKQRQKLHQLRMKSIDFRKLIATYFSIDEIKEVCFESGIKWENLEHTKLNVFSRELVEFALRSGKIQKVVEVCQEKRPNIEWPAF